MAWCAGRQKAGRGWHTGGVIMGTTRGSGARRPRLEPDDEQSSRPVLRGLGLGNEARLPDMENPLLEDGTPTLALLNRTGVGGPTLRLPAAHGCAQIRPGLRLGNNLVAVDRAHGRVAVTMKHDRGHRAPRAVERGA